MDDRHLTIQMMRAGGWRHMKGVTLGGEVFETTLCPGCAKNEKKRTRTKESIDQEEFPLDWGQHRTQGGQGISSR